MVVPAVGGLVTASARAAGASWRGLEASWGDPLPPLGSLAGALLMDTAWPVACDSFVAAGLVSAVWGREHERKALWARFAPRYLAWLAGIVALGFIGLPGWGWVLAGALLVDPFRGLAPVVGRRRHAPRLGTALVVWGVARQSLGPTLLGGGAPAFAATWLLSMAWGSVIASWVAWHGSARARP